MDSCFVDGLRQKPISKVRLSSWLEMSWDQILAAPELSRGIHRNNALINLSLIPDDIKAKIWEEYQTQLATPKKVNIIGYLQEHKLKTMMEHAGEF